LNTYQYIAANTNTVCGNSPDQCETTAYCDGNSASCPAYPSATNGTSCTDGDACTQSDACQSGVCTPGSPVICTASDQCHDAGICDTGTGFCSDPAKADNTSCDDANDCTQTDSCQTGICTGSNEITCSASDSCHDAGSCNPTDGQCSNPDKPDGEACTGSNMCNQTNTCQVGVCSGSNPVTCAPPDQCHNTGVCNSNTGECSYTEKPDGTSCTDNNACTQNDACESGVCTAGTPISCSAQDQCHTAGVCDTGTGLCSNPERINGASCDDGNACTQTDQCQAGSCSGGNPVVCTASDQCHSSASATAGSATAPIL